MLQSTLPADENKIVRFSTYMERRRMITNPPSPVTRDMLEAYARLYRDAMTALENGQSRETLPADQQKALVGLAGYTGCEANVSGVDLQQICLESVNLEGVNFSGANLSGANLQWTNLRGAIFDGADMRAAAMQHCTANKASFREADLRHVDLTDAMLDETNMESADLRESILRHATLQRANLQWAKMEHSHTEAVKFDGANLGGTMLSEDLGKEPYPPLDGGESASSDVKQNNADGS